MNDLLVLLDVIVINALAMYYKRHLSHNLTQCCTLTQS